MIRVNASVDEQRLADARDLMTHRGPDDAGLSIDGGVGLGFGRLSRSKCGRGAIKMCKEHGSISCLGLADGSTYSQKDRKC